MTDRLPARIRFPRSALSFTATGANKSAVAKETAGRAESVCFQGQ